MSSSLPTATPTTISPSGDLVPPMVPTPPPSPGWLTFLATISGSSTLLWAPTGRRWSALVLMRHWDSGNVSQLIPERWKKESPPISQCLNWACNDTFDRFNESLQRDGNTRSAHVTVNKKWDRRIEQIWKFVTKGASFHTHQLMVLIESFHNSLHITHTWSPKTHTTITTARNWSSSPHLYIARNQYPPHKKGEKMRKKKTNKKTERRFSMQPSWVHDSLTAGSSCTCSPLLCFMPATSTGTFATLDKAWTS